MKFYAVPLLAATLALGACGSSKEDSAETPDTEEVAAEANTIVDVVSGNEDFSTLSGALTAVELAETLTGEGPFTLFAPSNAAFEKLPAAALTALMAEESQMQLVGVLTHHLVADHVDAASLGQAIADNGGTYEIPTASGGTLTASMDGDAIVLTDAAGGKSTITATDVEASNGLVHVIDAVLMPE